MHYIPKDSHASTTSPVLGFQARTPNPGLCKAEDGTRSHVRGVFYQLSYIPELLLGLECPSLPFTSGINTVTNSNLGRKMFF